MKTAVCLVVRNEVRDIAEWISYHTAIGFDTLIVFDHCSDDGTRAVLESARCLYDLHIHERSDSSKRSQENAYDTAVATYREHFDWIAFIDSDEFFVINEEQPVNRFFEAYEDWDGIAIPWAIYGANGHEDFPRGLVIESFIYRAGSSFFPTRHVKSIVRPRSVTRCINAHCFELIEHREGAYCTPDGRAVHWWNSPEHGSERPGIIADAPDYGIARINHYFTRSRAHWLAKLKRGYPSDVAVRNLEQFEEYDRNEIADPLAARRAAVVRVGVARILQSL